ncbi:MAG: Smr/MutS family protein [Chitinophagales bacterium]
MEILDLHGISLENAISKVEEQMEWCLAHGIEILVINHGKGYHSSRNFSVIKQEVRRYLNDKKSYLSQAGYRVIFGEANYPVTLEFDEGHTLIVRKGLESDYLGSKQRIEKNQIVFSEEGRKFRKNAKRTRSQK